MPVKKNSRPRRKSLSTKFKQDPLGTSKSEWKKLNPITKVAVIATVAGATSLQAARQLNALPLVGQYLAIFTSWGSRLRTPRA